MPPLKGRGVAHALSRLSLLLLFPVLAGSLMITVDASLRPDGWGWALCIVTAFSCAVAAMDGSGLLVCPMSMLCCMVFLMQLSLLMAILLISASPEDLTHVPAGPAAASRLTASAAVAGSDQQLWHQLNHHQHHQSLLGEEQEQDIKQLQHPLNPQAGHEQQPTSPPIQAHPQAESGQQMGAVRGVGRGDQSETQEQHRERQEAVSTQTTEVPKLPQLATITVVLACAGEGEYAVKTAAKVVERTPAEVLDEVIVVDDGSSQKIKDVFLQSDLGKATLNSMRVRIIRHEKTLGLMIAKKTGGDEAKGDIIVFLDCHVSPRPNWYEEIRELIVQNPKRMVVPGITDLDLNTWEESAHTNVNTKTYLTWRADFDWFDDESPYVPVMSGGLLALSAFWWRATGGYDAGMRGWGGENLDQSLRSWLCGGEIMRAKSSRIAHMWRTSDPRTRAHYHLAGSAEINKRRVVAAWFDKFRVMYDPRMEQGDPRLDISSIQEVQARLNCKPFVHFLHRFRDVYIEGAVIPRLVFQLREKSTGLCITKSGEITRLRPCGPGGEHGNKEQLLHWANRRQSKAGAQHLRGGQVGDKHQCCSGIRFWSTDLCFDFADSAGVHTYLCDVTGQNANQQYLRREEDERILHQSWHAHGGMCLAPSRKDDGQGFPLGLTPCNALKGEQGRWEEIDAFEPIDTRLYKDEIRREGLADAAFPT
eukprot:gb/GFBE01000016.1/.p1 GENE.gb/GFBE01000016.1/~~gb/GFBE01000016.1/.p1  ORF type:complete len:704 (+),score=101.73 gb/GFBE01000016.1/:1-2112(+)